MPFSMCVLASGSGGNCTLVRLEGDQHLLIDAGLSPRRTSEHLADLGVDPDQVDHIVLTHLDHDHFHAGWSRALRKHPRAVHVHERHRRLAARRGVPVSCLRPFSDVFEPTPATTMTGRLLAHDQLGSVAYVLDHDGVRLGFTTDLGRVPRSLFDHFLDLDALAIESNYDRHMQLSSQRPPFVTDRIMGGAGHLSNEQALDAVLRIADRSRLGLVALLHLSRDCNDPRLVRRLY
ncbi:MAG: MBL fold metallo-hydrolase, partial [Planctomycetota bacterium]